MNQSEFTLWLHGYVEICGTRPDDRQWEIIKDHLALVFTKVTPDRPSQTYCTSKTNAFPATLPFRGIADDLINHGVLKSDGTPRIVQVTC